jgi:hypothetical protein
VCLQVAAGLSRSALETWAGDHADEVTCDLPYGGQVAVAQIADQAYPEYTRQFLSSSRSC